MRDTHARFGCIYTSLILWTVASAWGAALPSDPVEAAPLTPPELADVLQRVRVAASGEAWQKDGWRDPLIDKWLNNLVAEVRAATGDDKRALPVTFANVQPQPQAAQPGAAPVGDVDRIVMNGVERVIIRGAPATGPATAPASAPTTGPAAPGVADGPQQQQQPIVVNGVQRIQPLTNALVVGRDINVGHAQRSIILADGNARVSFANDSIIIARGAVYVAHGRGNVIVAGHFIHVSHDGQQRVVRNAGGQGFARGPNGMPLREAEGGGILVSGGVINVSHAYATVFLANRALRLSHATSCTFINQPADAAISNEQDSRQVAAPALRVTAPSHPLGSRVQLDWLVPDKGAVVRMGDRRIVADLGKPITSEVGKPIAELDGWRLSFCNEDYALFTNDREAFGVFTAATPPGE